MLRGIYSVANAMRYRSHEVDITANNIANASTDGFKKDRAAMRSFGDMLVSRINDQPDSPNEATPGPIGTMNLGGAAADSPFIDFSEGTTRVTGNPLDLCLKGPGFFALQTPDGVRYSRTGNFSLDSEGTIVNPSGDKLLGEDGNPITITSQAPISIKPDGEITQDNVPVAKINLVEFPDLKSIQKEGFTLFKTSDPAQPAPPAASNTTIEQGAIESSNVNPVESMIELIVSQRAYEAAARAVDMFNTSMTHVTAELGRLPS